MIRLLVPRYKLNLIQKVTYTTNNKQANFGHGSRRLLRILLPEKRNIARKCYSSYYDSCVCFVCISYG